MLKVQKEKWLRIKCAKYFLKGRKMHKRRAKISVYKRYAKKK